MIGTTGTLNQTELKCFKQKQKKSTIPELHKPKLSRFKLKRWMLIISVSWILVFIKMIAS